MKSRDEIRQMIDESWRMPSGPGRIAVTEEALRYVDAFGDDDLVFAARLAATEAYQLMRPGEMLAAFSWCLAEFKRDPGRRTPREARVMRFYFNHALVAMMLSPDVPLDRIHPVLEDMERIYQAAGQGMHCVHQRRWNLADVVGDLTAKEYWYDRWSTAECDLYHACDHRELTMRLAHLSAFERDKEAVALGLLRLNDPRSCSSGACDPSGVHIELMLPFARRGMRAEAARAHRMAYEKLSRTYREGKATMADLDDLALNLRFCGLTGNVPRALEILERHWDALEHAPSLFNEMEFAASAAMVLHRATELGHQKIRIGAEMADASALSRQLTERATAIAARFDARNGTTYQSRSVNAILTAEPIMDYLPLSSKPAGSDGTRPGGESA